MIVFTLIIYALDYSIALDMVNKVRQQMGAAPLRISQTLNSVAEKYADVMASRNTMGHSVDGTIFSHRIKSGGYPGKRLAENVGEGYKTLADVIKGWIASPGHLKNLINPAYTEFGIGVSMSADGRLYWSQEFGDSNTAGITSAPTTRYTRYTKPYSQTPQRSYTRYTRTNNVKWVCPPSYHFNAQGKCSRWVRRH